MYTCRLIAGRRIWPIGARFARLSSTDAPGKPPAAGPKKSNARLAGDFGGVNIPIKSRGDAVKPASRYQQRVARSDTPSSDSTSAPAQNDGSRREKLANMYTRTPQPRNPAATSGGEGSTITRSATPRRRLTAEQMAELAARPAKTGGNRPERPRREGPRNGAPQNASRGGRRPPGGKKGPPVEYEPVYEEENEDITHEEVLEASLDVPPLAEHLMPYTEAQWDEQNHWWDMDEYSEPDEKVVDDIEIRLKENEAKMEEHVNKQLLDLDLAGLQPKLENDKDVLAELRRLRRITYLEDVKMYLRRRKELKHYYLRKKEAVDEAIELGLDQPMFVAKEGLKWWDEYAEDNFEDLDNLMREHWPPAESDYQVSVNDHPKFNGHRLVEYSNAIPTLEIFQLARVVAGDATSKDANASQLSLHDPTPAFLRIAQSLQANLEDPQSVRLYSTLLDLYRAEIQRTFGPCVSQELPSNVFDYMNPNHPGVAEGKHIVELVNGLCQTVVSEYGGESPYVFDFEDDEVKAAKAAAAEETLMITPQWLDTIPREGRLDAVRAFYAERWAELSKPTTLNPETDAFWESVDPQLLKKKKKQWYLVWKEGREEAQMWFDWRAREIEAIRTERQKSLEAHKPTFQAEVAEEVVKGDESPLTPNSIARVIKEQQALHGKNVSFWTIAESLGVSDSALSSQRAANPVSVDLLKSINGKITPQLQAKLFRFPTASTQTAVGQNGGPAAVKAKN
ncbi:hypothetical protein CYLTODRAFT_485347 [Cylindrobasidium torrendii FP15055 ss-10]|uniref:Uncharacterized protein n=1 Tax=Cylindrobasidium torrendii FP15055 ss-10 TaxID=1314674 RepID=A0A0D7BV45_9AGAR|nr:hypothetical protein CYLTODRAFT_485347 [Cylindrobasidium torrendii FP15055 ss-10]